jgi:hypothetical protein
VTISRASEKYDGLTTTIKVMSYRRDEILNLRSMHAVPAGRPAIDQEHHDASSTHSINIEFCGIDGELPTLVQFRLMSFC